MILTRQMLTEKKMKKLSSMYHYLFGTHTKIKFLEVLFVKLVYLCCLKFVKLVYLCCSIYETDILLHPFSYYYSEVFICMSSNIFCQLYSALPWGIFLPPNIVNILAQSEINITKTLPYGVTSAREIAP